MKTTEPIRVLRDYQKLSVKDRTLSKGWSIFPEKKENIPMSAEIDQPRKVKEKYFSMQENIN